MPTVAICLPGLPHVEFPLDDTQAREFKNEIMLNRDVLIKPVRMHGKTVLVGIPIDSPFVIEFKD